MAADSTLLLSLVEEYVSGLQDSKANDTATGKRGFIFSSTPFQNSLLRKKALPRSLSCRFKDAQHGMMVN